MLMFSYGMNLDPDYMRGCRRYGPAKLPGWRLRFQYFADVEETGNPVDEVQGGLWRIDARQLQELDQREGYRPTGRGLYARRVETVEAEDDAYTAIVYCIAPEMRGSQRAPSPGYLSIIERGYVAFGLNPAPLHSAVAAARYEEAWAAGLLSTPPPGYRGQSETPRPKNGPQQ